MLEVKSISKSYYVNSNCENVVLNDICFTLPSRGFYFICGKSGCGKSTLLNSLAGFIRPEKGEIFYNGEDLISFNEKKLNTYIKEEIGVIFQNYNLIKDLSVKENIEIAMSIKNCGDYDRLDYLFEKYGFKGKENQIVETLSGGEKQRLALVRAILNKPNIIFCDEPTGALDEDNGFKLMEELKKLSEEVLVVCVTHNETYIDLFADGFIRLSEGKIIESKLERFFVDDHLKIDRKYKKAKNSFSSILTRKNCKNNAKLDSFSTISSCFAILVCLLSLFFRNGILSSKDSLIDSYGDAYSFSITKEFKQDIKDSNINLVRSERPEMSELLGLFEGEQVILMNSYDYLFSNEKSLIFEDKNISDFNLRPALSLNYEDNYAFVNEKLAESLYINKDNIDNNFEISLKTKCNYVYYSKHTNENIYLEIDIEVPFVIREVKSEFSYLNEQNLYYSPLYMDEYFNSFKIKEIYTKTGITKTIKEIVDEANKDDAITSYKVFGFATNESSRKQIEKISEISSSIKITNNGAFIVESFLSMIESLFIGLLLFIGISLATSLFIAAFLSLTSAIKNRKESAILSSLGASKNTIMEVYLKEEIIFSFSGLILGVGLHYLFIFLLNKGLKNFFSVQQIVQSNSLITLIILVLFMCVFFIVIWIPLVVLKKKKLVEELKEE